MLTFIKNTDLEEYFTDTNLINLVFCDELRLLEKEHITILPKLFSKNYPHSKLKTKSNDEFIPKSIEHEFIGELKDAQKPVMESLITKYENEQELFGVLEGRTGFGKTVCSGYLISKLKYKTAIIVNSKKLQRQWKESLLKFTTLEDDDVAIIDSSVNSSKTKQHLYDCDVVILTVGFLGSHVRKNFNETYNKISKCGFNFVIYDEVDNTSNTINYGSSSLLFDTSNILGLTATPFVHGLHSVILKNTIGPIIYTVKDYEFKPIISILDYNSKIGEHSEIQQKVMMCQVANSMSDNSILFLKASYNKYLVDSKIHSLLVVTLCVKLVKQGYRPLIIVTTIKQAIAFKSLFDKLSDPDIVANTLYRGDDKLDDNWNIICGVYKYCARAYDNTDITAIVVASPYTGKTSLIQILGRSLRADKAPKVFILSDSSVGIIFNDTRIINTLSSYYDIPKKTIRILNGDNMPADKLYLTIENKLKDLLVNEDVLLTSKSMPVDSDNTETSTGDILDVFNSI